MVRKIYNIQIQIFLKYHLQKCTLLSLQELKSQDIVSISTLSALIFTFYATTGAVKCNHQLVVATTGAFTLTSVMLPKSFECSLLPNTITPPNFGKKNPTTTAKPINIQTFFHCGSAVAQW